jgi:hypothetical protein
LEVKFDVIISLGSTKIDIDGENDMKVTRALKRKLSLPAAPCVIWHAPRTDSYPLAYTNRIYKSSWTRWAL